MENEFKAILFNDREVLVNREGVLKYPSRLIEKEASGKRFKHQQKEKEISLVGSGYKQRYLGTVVRSSKTGKQKNLLAHRAVAMAFIPNPNNYPQVHHRNGNQKDNRVENLEWTTNHGNSQEYTNRRPKKGYKSHCTAAGKRFTPRINIYGVQYSLGYFKTEKEAQQVYFDTYKEWWGIEPYLQPRLIP